MKMRIFRQKLPQRRTVFALNEQEVKSMGFKSPNKRCHLTYKENVMLLLKLIELLITLLK